MGLGGLGYHWQRLRRELGQRLPLGARTDRVRGYIPNRLTTYSGHEKHLPAPLRRAMAAGPGLVSEAFDLDDMAGFVSSDYVAYPRA